MASRLLVCLQPSTPWRARRSSWRVKTIELARTLHCPCQALPGRHFRKRGAQGSVKVCDPSH